MFTGIIQAVGEIIKIIPLENGIRIEILSDTLDLSDMRIGDSIAINGVCLTITSLVGSIIGMEVSQETLRCTQGLDVLGRRINLEKAMQLSDRINGHLVSGHVDGVGKVIKLEPIGENYTLTIKPPASLMRYIAKKGSITVNGVSLTVNIKTSDKFKVNLIPHTLAMTTLQELKTNMEVNLEVDMLARYLEQLLAALPR